MTMLPALYWVNTSLAQDTEPRRWAQLPTGVNFAGVGYGYIDGDIFFDPLLLIEEATFEMHKVGLVYMRTMGVLGKSARLDFTLPYIAGRWEGTVDSEFVNFRRRGPGDARMRFSMLLYGGPAETLQEFAKSEKSNTVVGAAVAVSMPTGKYNSDRLINMGANRWVVRPQLGVTHNRGKWTGELTGSVFIYADNDHFWKDTKLETDPLFALQAHLIYNFRPGLWASLSTAYGWGGEATVNGDAKNNPSGNWLTALSFGFPINRMQGIKIAWIRGRTQKRTGADIDSIALGYSIMF
ncbi:MAG: transporter [Lysobacterales bacterium]